MSSTYRRFVILGGFALLATPIAAAPIAGQERFFPNAPSFERPSASPRVNGVTGRLLSVTRGESRYGAGREAEVALGENFPIFGFGSWPVTLGFGAAVYGRFSLNDPHSALISNDWLVGVNATANFARWSTTLELSHESSHLGDEYEDQFGDSRVDWTREIITGWVSYTAGQWRLTGALSYVLIDALGLERGMVAAGIDYRGRLGRAFGSVLRPLGGVFVEAAAATAWRMSTSGRLGVALSTPGGNREVAISIIGHNGLSTQRQFFRQTSRYIGLELRFDL